MAQADRAPHSLVEYLCRSKTSPPLGHDRECGTKKFLPHPSQYVGMFKGTIPYHRGILYRNSSHDNSVPLMLWVIAVSQAPLFFACQRRFSTALSSRSFRIDSTALSASSTCFCPSYLALRTQSLCAICCLIGLDVDVVRLRGKVMMG